MGGTIKNSSVQKDNVIRNYLDNIWKRAQSGRVQLAFFNGIGGELSNYIDEYTKDRLGDSKGIFFKSKVRKKSYKSPYYPFLDMVKGYLKDNNIQVDKYIEDSKVYYFQRPIFSSYFKGVKSYREDEVILEELEYEKQQVLSSIFKLISEAIGDKEAIVYIEDLNHIGESTLEFIEHIIEREYKGKIMFIFSFDEKQALLMDGDRSEKWSKFINRLKSKYEVVNYKENQKSKHNTCDSQGYSNEVGFRELLDLSNHCFNLFALKEGERYIKVAYQNYQDNNLIEENKEDYIELLQIMGDIYSYSNQNDNALKYYQILLNHLEGSNKVSFRAEVCRKIALVYFKKYNMEQGDKFARKSLKIAHRANDELNIFKAQFLICLIQEKWRTFNSKDWEELYDDLIYMGKRLNLKNSLARCYIHYYIDTDSTYNGVVGFYDKGLEIAQRYNNRYREAVAYHTRGILYVRERDYSQVLKYYNKSRELKEKIGGEASLVYIYNGLGYYHFLMESYAKAYEYFDKSLHFLRRVKDYHEIGMTCINIGFTMFLACDNERVILYLNECLDILRVLEIKSFMYHSKCKIYSMLGISYLKLGKLNKAYEALIKIEFKSCSEMIEENNDSFQFFFLDMFKAMLAKEDDDYIKSEGYFKSSLNHLKNIEFTKEHLYPRFYYEYGLMKDYFANYEESKSLFKRSLKHCEEIGYNFHKRLVLSQIDGQAEFNKFKIKEDNFDFKWLSESVELEDTLNKLYNQIDKVKFLNLFQKIISEVRVKKNLIKRVMEFIEDNFLIENLILYIEDNGTWKGYSSDKKVEERYPPRSKFIKSKAIDPTEEELIYNNEDQLYREFLGSFSSVVSIPLKVDGRTFGLFVGFSRKENHKVSQDDFDILSISGKQLSIALEKINKNEQLREKNDELRRAYDELLRFSKNDPLTGLYNRHELMVKVKAEESRVRRYGKKRGKGFSLAFIDLDNFKYYNDRFGHNIGDLLLCKFANLLEIKAREVDFISRFGGDEFIVVLPEIDSEGASFFAKRIQEALISSNYFKEDIEGYLGEEVEIPNYNILSSSVGISEYKFGMDIDTDELIRRADKAMYSSKRDGKGQIVIYNDSKG